MSKLESESFASPIEANPTANWGQDADLSDTDSIIDRRRMWCELPRHTEQEVVTGDVLHITTHSKFHSETLALVDGNTFSIGRDGNWSLYKENEGSLDKGKNLAAAGADSEVYKYNNGATVTIDKNSGDGELRNTDGSIVTFNRLGIWSVTRDGITAHPDRSRPAYERDFGKLPPRYVSDLLSCLIDLPDGESQICITNHGTSPTAFTPGKGWTTVEIKSK